MFQKPTFSISVLAASLAFWAGLVRDDLYQKKADQAAHPAISECNKRFAMKYRDCMSREAEDKDDFLDWPLYCKMAWQWDHPKECN
jgi:hypothetical protein